MSDESRFYITTPIYYVNDKPHIGHAYTTIAADVLARWRRGQGEDVIFLSGTDEFAQKTVDAAKKNDEDVGAYTDRMASLYQSAWRTLEISNTDFIRTTESRHIETVKDFWERLDVAGDLYKEEYEGLYCKGHEAFLDPSELTPDGLCPLHKTKPEFISEENYFFRLSKYQKPLLDFYGTHEDFVAPPNRFVEMKKFVERGLVDISFSRERKPDREPWGIPVPNDPRQVIYVWADALVNYISAVGVEGWEGHPADVHMVGKDILRFHAVIWPAMLLSAGLPLPGQVVANGFLTIGGAKISKTVGNVIDPIALTRSYGADAVRYFLLRSEEHKSELQSPAMKMKERYNADLANGLGNFAARVSTLAAKEVVGGLKISEDEVDNEFKNVIADLEHAVGEKLGTFKFNEALAAIASAIAFGDRYVNEKKIWEMKDDGVRRQALANLVALLEAIAAVLAPFLPEAAKRIKAAIERDAGGLRVKKIETLFPRLA